MENSPNFFSSMESSYTNNQSNFFDFINNNTKSTSAESDFNSEALADYSNATDSTTEYSDDDTDLSPEGRTLSQKLLDLFSLTWVHKEYTDLKEDLGEDYTRDDFCEYSGLTDELKLEQRAFYLLLLPTGLIASICFIVAAPFKAISALFSKDLTSAKTMVSYAKHSLDLALGGLLMLHPNSQHGLYYLGRGADGFLKETKDTFHDNESSFDYSEESDNEPSFEYSDESDDEDDYSSQPWTCSVRQGRISTPDK